MATETSSTTSRRMLLGAIATAPVAIAGPTVMAADDPDAWLKHCVEQFIATTASQEAADDDLTWDRLDAERVRWMEECERLEPATVGGLAALLRFAFVRHCTGRGAADAMLAGEVPAELREWFELSDDTFWRLAGYATRVASGRV